MSDITEAPNNNGLHSYRKVSVNRTKPAISIFRTTKRVSGLLLIKLFPILPVLLLVLLMAWAHQNDITRVLRSGFVQAMVDKTVLIQCGPDIGKGSGFFIDKEHFFTAYHVIKDCPKEKLLIDKQFVVDQVVYKDAEKDAALIKVFPTPALKPDIATLDCTFPHYQQRVTMAGFPLSVTDRVKTIDGQVVIPYWFGGPDGGLFTAIVDNEVFQGMSGGPVFDRESNKVIGWNVYVASPNKLITKYAGIGLFYDVCDVVINKNRAALSHQSIEK